MAHPDATEADKEFFAVKQKPTVAAAPKAPLAHFDDIQASEEVAEKQTPTVAPGLKSPLTNVQRQLSYVKRKRAAGLKQIHNFWAHPDDIAAIKEFAAGLEKRRDEITKA